jgi:hypothetical protein
LGLRSTRRLSTASAVTRPRPRRSQSASSTDSMGRPDPDTSSWKKHAPRRPRTSATSLLESTRSSGQSSWAFDRAAASSIPSSARRKKVRAAVRPGLIARAEGGSTSAPRRGPTALGSRRLSRPQAMSPVQQARSSSSARFPRKRAGRSTCSQAAAGASHPSSSDTARRSPPCPPSASLGSR